MWFKLHALFKKQIEHLIYYFLLVKHLAIFCIVDQLSLKEKYI